MAKKYKVGQKFKLVGGNLIQITSVNKDGTANFSGLDPKTKKPYPFGKGLQGKLPSLEEQGKDRISLTFDITEEEMKNFNSLMSVDEYNLYVDTTAKGLESPPFNFTNFTGFKKYVTDNVGKVKLKLVDTPEVTIHGNVGDTVVRHPSIGQARTVDSVNSRGFTLDGSFVEWGAAGEWDFSNTLAVWTGEDGHYLVYEIV